MNIICSRNPLFTDLKICYLRYNKLPAQFIHAKSEKIITIPENDPNYYFSILNNEIHTYHLFFEFSITAKDNIVAERIYQTSY